MIEKYGTYRVFQNKETGALRKISLEEDKELEKVASDAIWKELEFDPEDTTTIGDKK
ncbi:MAG TPA: hypothetical protein PKN48_00370 [Bacteroidales bacterium]|nr:hypothetical protein [Bacteroidales bacterium]